MQLINIYSLFLRLALAAGFFSAVASRLSLWGTHSSGWSNFLEYTAQVNSFFPKSFIPTIAVTSTLLETVLAIFLLLGLKTRYAALGSACLTLLFAFAMTYSFGLKETLDYSVLPFSAGAFLLAAMPHHKYSIDHYYIINSKKKT